MRAYDLVELAGRNLREAVLRDSLRLGHRRGCRLLVAMLSSGACDGSSMVNWGVPGSLIPVYVTSRQDFRGRSMRNSEIRHRPGRWMMLPVKSLKAYTMWRRSLPA